MQLELSAGFTSVNWTNSCGPIILITVRLIAHCLCSSFGVPTYAATFTANFFAAILFTNIQIYRGWSAFY